MTVPSGKFVWQGNGCAAVSCDNCGDRMIHQYRRGPHESSSALGQFVHDYLPHDFGWSDIDGVSWRSRTRTIRIFEHKKPGAALNDSQRAILKRLGEIVAAGRDSGAYGPASGVYMIRSEPPWRTAHIYDYADESDVVDIEQSQLVRLLRGLDWHPGRQLGML